MFELEISEIIRSDELQLRWIQALRDGLFTGAVGFTQFDGFAQFDVSQLLAASQEHFSEVVVEIGNPPLRALETRKRAALIDSALSQYAESRILEALVAQAARISFSTKASGKETIAQRFLAVEGTYHRKHAFLSRNGIDDDVLKVWLLATYQLDRFFAGDGVLSGSSDCKFELEDPFLLAGAMAGEFAIRISQWDAILSEREFSQDDAQHAVVSHAVHALAAIKSASCEIG